MHTFVAPSGIRFHFNSDRSGDVVATSPHSDVETRIPCDDVLAFVAELVRRDRASSIEDMEDAELLGLSKSSKP